MPAPKSRNSKSSVDSVISLTSSSNHDSNPTGPTLGTRDKNVQPQDQNHQPNVTGKLCNVPTRSLVPVMQSRLGETHARHTASGEKATRDHKRAVSRYCAYCNDQTDAVNINTVAIPSGFLIHPGDVIPLARYGYDVRVSEIAGKLGFQESVAQEIYEQVSSFRQMEEVLRAMQNAAKRCGEKLIAGDDLNTDSEA